MNMCLTHGTSVDRGRVIITGLINQTIKSLMSIAVAINVIMTYSTFNDNF
jgi:hypothetical protein